MRVRTILYFSCYHLSKHLLKSAYVNSCFLGLVLNLLIWYYARLLELFSKFPEFFKPYMWVLMPLFFSHQSYLASLTHLVLHWLPLYLDIITTVFAKWGSDSKSVKAEAHFDSMHFLASPFALFSCFLVLVFIAYESIFSFMIISMPWCLIFQEKLLTSMYNRINCSGNR